VTWAMESLVREHDLAAIRTDALRHGHIGGAVIRIEIQISVPRTDRADARPGPYRRSDRPPAWWRR
jgi:hypothetical protein